MQDIRPPKRPLSPPPVASETTPPSPGELPQIQDPQSPKPKKRRLIWWILGGVIGLIVILIASAVVWYKLALRPVNANDATRTRVTVTAGMTPSDIGQLLEGKKLINNGFAFDIYTRLSGTRDKLQAGTYSFSPSDSTRTIVANLASGKVAEFEITFLPGETAAHDQEALVKAGFARQDVDAAFKKAYDRPLFATKPAGTDLEGYIYGETYKVSGSATVEQVLEKTFDEYENVIAENGLTAAFKKQGLTLYQGITLASVIQSEVSNTSDQKQVAQIFLKRLKEGIPLGSDVTAYYGAEKAGLTRSVATDTPYNTRIHKGLPPGPIASPGLSALLAVAHPAKGNYLYFLSGDDDKTYFSKTSEEHEANIRDHCQVKCAVQ